MATTLESDVAVVEHSVMTLQRAAHHSAASVQQQQASVLAPAVLSQTTPPASTPEIVGALDTHQEVASSPQVRPEAELLELLAAAEASSAQMRAYAKAGNLAKQTKLLQNLARQIEAKRREEELAAAHRQYQDAARHHTGLQALQQQMTRAVEEARRLLQA
jgi:hypothetical protein